MNWTERLSLARGNPAAHHFTLSLVHRDGAVWVYRPHRVAAMQRGASLRNAQHTTKGIR